MQSVEDCERRIVSRAVRELNEAVVIGKFSEFLFLQTDVLVYGIGCELLDAGSN